MTTIPLTLATLLYAWVAAGYAWQRNWPMCLTWICYAGANAGFIWMGHMKG